MTVDEMVLADYQSLTIFDLEVREHYSAYANQPIDEGWAADLRAGIAGKLNDEALDGLIGYRVRNFHMRGNTDAQKGSLEWHKLAMALCVSEYEALARKVERDVGDFAGKPEHPRITNAVPAADEIEPVSLRGLLASYLKLLEQNGKAAKRGSAGRQCLMTAD